MSPELIGVPGFIIMFVLFFMGFEIGFAMAFVGFAGFAYLTSFQAACNLLAKDIVDVFTGYTLTVIPLFIFMGQLAVNSGIGRRLYDLAFKFIGHIPGGLAMATVIGCCLQGVRLVKLAAGFGVPGASVRTAEDLSGKLAAALAEPGPFLIEMVL